VQKLAGGEKFIGYKDVSMGLKTGTAQVGGDLLPHAWVIGFVEKGTRSAVIVVLLEHRGGSQLVLPFFQKVSRVVIENYLVNNGQP